MFVCVNCVNCVNCECELCQSGLCKSELCESELCKSELCESELWEWTVRVNCECELCERRKAYYSSRYFLLRLWLCEIIADITREPTSHEPSQLVTHQSAGVNDTPLAIISYN